MGTENIQMSEFFRVAGDDEDNMDSGTLLSRGHNSARSSGGASPGRTSLSDTRGSAGDLTKLI